MRRRRRRILAAGLALLALAVLAGGCLVATLLFLPPEFGIEGEPLEVAFEIERGELLGSIAARLHEAGLIRDPLALKLASFLGGSGSGIKAGVHRLRRDMNAWDLMRALRDSPQAEFTRLVLPEGWDSFEIARRIEEAGIAAAGEFRRAVADPGQISDLAPQAASLEGYLFPDTYHVPTDAGPQELAAMMVRRFRVMLNGELLADLEAAGLSPHEGVILASLIAREAGNFEEMPLISSVFHNRLRLGMKLDCDPTIIYALKLEGRWDGDIRWADKELDSPYNTYISGGLPPGPIGNPGAEALRAAARPADTDYLYFVAKSPTESHFSRTLREHNRAVRRYVLER